jgi:hypothetical protein
MPMIIRILQLTLPWISIIFLPKRSFKKYLPVSIFAAILVSGMCLLAGPLKWWNSSDRWKARLLNDFSFIFGPFFVGTLWIFHFTFGNIKRYFLANLLMDSLFSFPLTYLYQKLKVFKLGNFKPSHIFLTFISFSFIIYGFQMLIQKKVEKWR